MVMTINTFFEFVKNTNFLYELRNGVPVRMDSPEIQHQKSLGELHDIFKKCLSGTKCHVLDSPCDIIFTNNETRVSDLIIVRNESKIQGKKCIGAPDFIAEVLSPSTVQKDYENKELYLSCDVKEYWILDTVAKSVQVYLTNGDYCYYEYPQHLVIYPSLFPNIPVELKFLFDKYTRTEYVIYSIKLLALNIGGELNEV